MKDPTFFFFLFLVGTVGMFLYTLLNVNFNNPMIDD